MTGRILNDAPGHAMPCKKPPEPTSHVPLHAATPTTARHPGDVHNSYR